MSLSLALALSLNQARYTLQVGAGRAGERGSDGEQWLAECAAHVGAPQARGRPPPLPPLCAPPPPQPSPPATWIQLGCPVAAPVGCTRPKVCSGTSCQGIASVRSRTFICTTSKVFKVRKSPRARILAIF
jgi:hypothetical protein